MCKVLKVNRSTVYKIMNHTISNQEIDRIDLEREMGKKIYDAIVSACQQRLRPIIITTLTTTLGLLTLIIPHDPLFYGLANIIAYGLAVGTFLTLAVVPVLYSLMFKDKKVLKKQS